VFSTGPQVFVADTLGNSNPINSNDSDHTYHQPRWSPTGSLIISNRESAMAPYPQEIWRTSATGTGGIQIIDHFGQHSSWSPDGSVLVYDYNGEVMTSTVPTGPGANNITNDPAADTSPAWSPDGNHLAMQSDRTGDDEIYSMEPAGAGIVNLTNDPGGDQEPSWSACPP
jgi:TolB protein